MDCPRFRAKPYSNTIAPPNWQWPTCQNNSSGFASDRNGTYPARSRHPGGCVHALADASVRFISETVELKTYQYVGSINGGEVIGEF